MGVIRKQGLWSTLFIYSGFAFGFLNAIILFPKFLSQEHYGLTMVLLDAGKFVSSLALMGSLSVLVKFSPYYRANLKNRENDILTLTTLISGVGFLLVSLVILLKSDFIIRKFGANSPEFTEHFFLIIPIAFFFVLYNLLETYASIFHYTRVGALLREVGVRIFVSLLLILVGFKWISVQTFLVAYSLQYGMIVIILILVLVKLKQFILPFKFSKVTKRYKKKILIYASYMQGGILISVAAVTVDSIFIASMGGLPKVATFTIGRYLAELVQAPYRAFGAISAPIISDAWRRKDYGLLESIYKKTSINQLLAGILVFGGLWINLDWILHWLGNGFYEAKPVFLVLGLTRVIDLGAGLNAEILGSSNKWRFNFLSQAILMFLFIPINFILLKNYGIVGSAFASLIAFFSYNLVRFIYILRVFKLQPFTRQTLYPILMGIGLLGLYETLLSPAEPNPLQQLFYSAAFAALFVGLALYLRISEDLNKFLSQLKARMLKKAN